MDVEKKEGGTLSLPFKHLRSSPTMAIYLQGSMQAERQQRSKDETLHICREYTGQKERENPRRSKKENEEALQRGSKDLKRCKGQEKGTGENRSRACSDLVVGWG
jgi:hypothetical protein